MRSARAPPPPPPPPVCPRTWPGPQRSGRPRPPPPHPPPWRTRRGQRASGGSAAERGGRARRSTATRRRCPITMAPIPMGPIPMAPIPMAQWPQYPWTNTHGPISMRQYQCSYQWPNANRPMLVRPISMHAQVRFVELRDARPCLAPDAPRRCAALPAERVAKAPAWLFSAESDVNPLVGRTSATMWGATPPPAAIVHFVCSSWPGSDGRRAAMELWGRWHMRAPRLATSTDLSPSPSPNPRLGPSPSPKPNPNPNQASAAPRRSAGRRAPRHAGGA
eukprot:scaffold24760_cov63-Phaeocystis_antarctica.AAC.1